MVSMCKDSPAEDATIAGQTTNGTHTNGAVLKAQPLGRRLQELFEENITAKIIRTAIDSLQNNVRLLLDIIL